MVPQHAAEHPSSQEGQAELLRETLPDLGPDCRHEALLVAGHAISVRSNAKGVIAIFRGEDEVNFFSLSVSVAQIAVTPFLIGSVN